MLKYDGRKVNVATFNSEGKDLRKLVGRCDKMLRGNAALPTWCPYEVDVHSKFVDCVLCKSCDHERAMDI